MHAFVYFMAGCLLILLFMEILMTQMQLQHHNMIFFRSHKFVQIMVAWISTRSVYTHDRPCDVPLPFDYTHGPKIIKHATLLVLSFCYAPKDLAPFFFSLYIPKNPLSMIKYEVVVDFSKRPQCAGFQHLVDNFNHWLIHTLQSSIESHTLVSQW